MTIDMDTTRLGTIEQVRAFLAGLCDAQLRTLHDDGERRRFVERTLCRFGYFRRPRHERGLLFAYVQRVSGYSRAHVIRLVADEIHHFVGSLTTGCRGATPRPLGRSRLLLTHPRTGLVFFGF